LKRPDELRAAAGVTVVELANRLGLATADVMYLEQLDLRLWEVDSAAQYLKALGLRLELVAVAQDGTREELER
jgi:hypothetical protein